MPTIKFSHDYPKLWKQTEATLLDVKIITAADFNDSLLEYDTKISEGEYYVLPKKGKFLQLIFYGNYLIPFCTIRSYNPEKEKYYKNLIGEVFTIVKDN